MVFELHLERSVHCACYRLYGQQACADGAQLS